MLSTACRLEVQTAIVQICDRCYHRVDGKEKRPFRELVTGVQYPYATVLWAAVGIPLTPLHMLPFLANPLHAEPRKGNLPLFLACLSQPWSLFKINRHFLDGTSIVEFPITSTSISISLAGTFDIANWQAIARERRHCDSNAPGRFRSRDMALTGLTRSCLSPLGLTPAPTFSQRKSPQTKLIQREQPTSPTATYGPQAMLDMVSLADSR